MLKDYLSKLLAVAMVIFACSYSNAQEMITVDAPATVAGSYTTIQAAFGPWSDGQTGMVVEADDGAGVTNGCDPITVDMTGAIALIDRGACGFVQKTANAEAQGAIAVIVCNNNMDMPDEAIVMGGGDGCTLTIPAQMISYNDCQTIRAELGNGLAVTFPSNVPAAGDAIGAEEALPGAGTYTAATLVGTSVFADADSARYYTVVAPMDGVMNVHSCLGGADTRVSVLQGCRNVLSVVGQNDDFCELTAGGPEYASSLDVIVYSGQEYIIMWDDRWSPAGFDFEVSFTDLPMVDVTLHVDMQDEMVDPAGAHIIGTFTLGGPELMTDDGDGTWSYTVTTLAGYPIYYRFANGLLGVEEATAIEACSFDDGSGIFARGALPGLGGGATALVCFNSCAACPPDVACPNWILDDFEAYDLGGISAQSDDWTQWTAGSAGEDADVSDAFALSGGHSMNISAADPDDMILRLGDRTEGNFILKWKMYVPAGSGGYYNLQKYMDMPGAAGGFANEVVFNADGTGGYDVGGETFAFDYPHDTWFEVFHNVDIDNDRNRAWINGVPVADHPNSYQGGDVTGDNQLGGVDFFGLAASSSNYYVDDVLFKQVDPCPADAIICDGLDGYDLGTLSGQSPWWDAWSFDPGATDHGEVSSEQQASCEQSMKISETDPDDVLLMLGDLTAGNYTLSWNMYIPSGSSGYYNTQKFQNGPGDEFGIQVFLNDGGTGTLDAGGAGIATFTYPQDEWFSVSHALDLDNDEATLTIAGTDVYTFLTSGQATTADPGTNQLGAIDFFGNAGNLYWIDDVLLVGEVPVMEPNIEVTFGVDLTYLLANGIDLETVKIAGTFGTNGAVGVPDWDPTASPVFTDQGDDVWTTTIEFPASSAGQDLLFKFLNTADSWGTSCDTQVNECLDEGDGDCKDPGSDNRIYTIPAENSSLCWTYNTCIACNELVNSREQLIDIPMTIAPNPFSQEAIVTFNTPIVDAEARLTTLTGQLTRTYQINGTQLVIEKEGLQPGVYFFTVVTEDGASTAEKLIVQ